MFSGPIKELNAWIGPSISQKNYEVSHKFIRTFSEVNVDYKSCFKSYDNKNFLDLQMLAKLQLLESKLMIIDTVQRCVFREGSSFYSFRREKPKKRMSAIIWIE